MQTNGKTGYKASVTLHVNVAHLHNGSTKKAMKMLAELHIGSYSGNIHMKQLTSGMNTHLPLLWKMIKEPKFCEILKFNVTM